MVAGTLALARARLRNKGRLNIANIPKQTNPFATSVSTASEEPTTMAALSFGAQTGVSVLLRGVVNHYIGRRNSLPNQVGGPRQHREAHDDPIDGEGRKAVLLDPRQEPGHRSVGHDKRHDKANCEDDPVMRVDM